MERFSFFHHLRLQAMRNALVFFFLGIAIYSLWPAGPKDYLLNTLELFHDFLEQPSVDRNGRITTDFKAQSLSYTLRASCELLRLLREPPRMLTVGIKPGLPIWCGSDISTSSDTLKSKSRFISS